MDVWDTLFRLAITFVFVFINAFFVVAEFALVKVRPTRIASLSRLGKRRAVIVRKMLDRLDLYLSACQLGITLASLILGWLAEPAVATILIAGAHELAITMDPALLHGIALGIALAVVTILHMTIGEQAPKIWAIHKAESMAMRVAYPLFWFTLALRPLIWLVNAISGLLLRLVGLGPGAHGESPPTVDDMRAMVASSAHAGYITERQREFVGNVFSLAKLEARHLVVPRKEIVFLRTGDPVGQSFDTMAKSKHTRFPLCENDLETVMGILHTKSVMAALTGGHTVDDLELASLVVPPIFIPEHQPVSRVMQQLQRAGSGCAVVVDEYGTAVGMVFLDDALEHIIGRIRDEFDPPLDREDGIVGVGDDITMEGRTALPTACEALDMDDPGGSDTIGGHVVNLLGRLPRSGDVVSVGRYDVEIVEVEDRHVKTLRFTPRASRA